MEVRNENDIKKLIIFNNDDKDYEFELKRVDCRKLIIDTIIDKDDDFKKWYIPHIIELNSKGDFENFNIEKVIEFTKFYMENLYDVNLGKYVNKKKKTKSSIFFDEDEITRIIKMIVMLKLSSPIINSLDITRQVKNDIFGKIMKVTGMELINKIYLTIRSRIWRFSNNDPYMWNLVKLKSSINEKTFLIIAFNSIISSVLINHDLKRNPITFISSVAGDMTGWFLKDLRVESTIYEETPEIYNSITINLEDKITYKILNRIETYTIRKLNEDGYNIQRIEELINQSSKNKFLSLVSLPVLSKLTQIPIQEIQKSPIKKQYFYHMFLYYVFKNNERYLDSAFLDYFRVVFEDTLQYLNQTQYRIKNISKLFNTEIKYFGTNNKSIILEIFTAIMICITKFKYKTLFGNEVSKYSNVDKLENDILEIVKFLTVINYKEHTLFKELNDTMLDLIKYE